MSDSSSPRPVEDKPGLPWPLVVLWKITKVLLIIGFTLWLAATLAFNFLLKDAIEGHLTQVVGKKVTIAALRAGWDLARPTIALMNAKVWNGPDSYDARIDTLELGFYIDGSSVSGQKQDLLFYAGVDGINLGGKPYGDYEAKFRVGDPTHVASSDILIEDLKGEYRGAKLHGAGSIKKDQLKADVAAENVDYSLLAEGVKGGKAHVKLDLVAAEKDPVKTLKGRATLTGGEGRLEGNALNVWAGSLLTAFLPGQSKDTHLNCTVADFDIRDGVAHSRTVIIDTDKATITGTGTVDLVRKRVDMRFTPRTKGLAVISLATPMIVSGPFGDVTTRPDPTGVAEKMGGFLLGAVAAPAALLPFLHSNADANPCQKFLDKGGK